MFEMFTEYQPRTALLLQAYVGFYSKMNSFRCLYLTLLEHRRSCAVTKESGSSAHQSSCINPLINFIQAQELPRMPHDPGLLVSLNSECYALRICIVLTVTAQVDNLARDGTFFLRTHCLVLKNIDKQSYLSAYVTHSYPSYKTQKLVVIL